MLPALNAWLGELFDRDHIDQTVAALLAPQHGRADTAAPTDRDAAEQRLADTEKRLSRLRTAIEAGADPAALVESLHAAQEQRTAAQHELAIAKPDPWELTEAEVDAMVDALGDVGASLTSADPARMEKDYRSLRLEMVYDHEGQALDVLIKPLGGLCVCPRGEVSTIYTTSGVLMSRSCWQRRSSVRCLIMPYVSSRVSEARDTHTPTTDVDVAGGQLRLCARLRAHAR